MVMTGKRSVASLQEGTMDRSFLVGISLVAASTSPLVVHSLQKMAFLKVSSSRLFRVYTDVACQVSLSENSSMSICTLRLV